MLKAWTQVLVLSRAKADAIVRKLKASDAYLKPGYLVTCDQVARLRDALVCARWQHAAC